MWRKYCEQKGKRWCHSITDISKIVEINANKLNYRDAKNYVLPDLFLWFHVEAHNNPWTPKSLPRLQLIVNQCKRLQGEQLCTAAFMSCQNIVTTYWTCANKVINLTGQSVFQVIEMWNAEWLKTFISCVKRNRVRRDYFAFTKVIVNDESGCELTFIGHLLSHNPAFTKQLNLHQIKQLKV